MQITGTAWRNPTKPGTKAHASISTYATDRILWTRCGAKVGGLTDPTPSDQVRR
jgi:hypothetical protein